MEVIGTNHLNSSKAQELFESGKEWIVKRAAADGRNVSKISILPKTVGRNKGFIMDVSVSGTEEHIKYYAKIQSIHIDTVMMHYFLKFAKCGPDEFLVVLLTSVDESCSWERAKHGIITREAENCKMASAWTKSEACSIGSSEKLFRGDSFMLTLLVAFGHFGNLPNNRDNWGFASWEGKTRNESPSTSPSLMIVDFSYGGTDNAISSLDNFLVEWIVNTATMCKLWPNDKDFSLKQYGMEFLHGNLIPLQALEVPWLRSQQHLLIFLQRVCDATEQWLVNTMDVLNDSGDKSKQYDTFTDSYPVGETSYPLTPFAHIPAPDTCEDQDLLYMMDEYDKWIELWNALLEKLFTWFPFPYAAPPAPPPIQQVHPTGDSVVHVQETMEPTEGVVSTGTTDQMSNN